MLERIRRFWGSQPAGNHPLSEDERETLREEDRTHLAHDERAHVFDQLAGDNFDPDDRRPGQRWAPHAVNSRRSRDAARQRRGSSSA